MINPIKYSTELESDALKKGNMYLGTGAVGKGPSDITGYYQGPSPTPGGYVIYLYNGSAPGNLSYHSALDDSELIKFTNELANQSYTTAQECFNYYYGQVDKVLINQNYPANFPYIIMDGLILYLDANISISYSGSGTQWNDINGLGPKNNATLSGPIFDNDSFSFDGNNDYVTISQEILSNETTICFWIKPENDTFNIQTLFSNSTGGFTTNGIRIFFNSYETSDRKIFIETANGSGGNEIKTNTGLIVDDVWQFLSFSMDRINSIGKIYYNGELVKTGFVTSDYKISGTSYIGLMIDNFPYFGNISSVQIYNRILTDEEIETNYNNSIIT